MVELDKVAHEIAAGIDGFDWNQVDTEDMSEDEEFYPEEEEQSDKDESGSEEEKEEITNEHNLDEDVMDILYATHLVVTKAYLEKLQNNSKKLILLVRRIGARHYQLLTDKNLEQIALLQVLGEFDTQLCVKIITKMQLLQSSRRGESLIERRKMAGAIICKCSRMMKGTLTRFSQK